MRWQDVSRNMQPNPCADSWSDSLSNMILTECILYIRMIIMGTFFFIHVHVIKRHTHIVIVVPGMARTYCLRCYDVVNV